MYSRLTTATMYGSLMNSLQESQRKIQDLQQQIASGNKYLNLAENPAAISRSLTIQSAINANNQYQSNTQNAVTMLKHADSALNNVLDAAQAIRDLVISAGTALPEDQLKDISAQIEANKKIMLDNLNTKVAGQYIFGGTDSSKPPFVETSDGNIIYQGTDDRIKYALSESLLGDISFTGNDIIPEDEDSYFICSHYVPLDWKWTGREEKVQITVGNRTLSVFIPENWSDNDINKTNKLTSEDDEENEVATVNFSDHNGYRDPNELSGLSLEDLVTIVNSSLEEQGADMLVHAYIEKDPDANRQQLIIKSNTGEKVGITGWPDTDYMPMPATITTNADFESTPNWNSGVSGSIQGIVGNVNLADWKTLSPSGTLSVKVGGNGAKNIEIDLSALTSANELVEKLNSAFTNSGSTKFASLSPNNRLVLRSDNGTINVEGEGCEEIFGVESGESTDSSLTITVGNEAATAATIYFSNGESMEDIAEKINDIEGVYARVTADRKNLVVVAERIGSMPEDSLNINEAEEALHYPSLMIKATGQALDMFDFTDEEITEKNDAGETISATRTARTTTRLKDQSHIDIFDYLGMETATKSREFAFDDTLTVETGEQLHWRVISGGRSADIKLNPGSYTIDELASRLKNAGTGWLEVTVEPGGTDVEDDWGTGTNTKRIVMRGYNGEQVIFLDMNEYNYADKLGISTALRTDAYDDKQTDETDDDYIGTGMKCVNFPSAPCVDDNVGIPMRVQMNCGMYYDVNIKKADVVDKQTGFVDRGLVMQEIVDQVNEQEGHDIMGFVQHVDSTGEEIPGSCAIYFLSGEAFTVVDMPFNDPEWNDYSGGLAAQMGIHGGVTSNLRQTTVKMLDNATFAEAYDNDYNKYRYDIEANEENIEFREGTIRFSNLAHSVEIDVSGDDTVKDVMDRLRTQAGDWLYVNYYDTHMGQLDIENSGDFPIISISSIDGSAVNVLDIKGHIAEDALGLSTGIQGRINPDGDDDGVESDDLEWNEDNTPATALNITVAGYTHTIDLTALRDVNSDKIINSYDVAEFVNARMQDYDVRAEVNEDKELVFYSPRGYSIKVEFLDENEESVTENLLGTDFNSEEINRTLYRGGYNLEGESYSRGIDDDLYASGIHTQNATIRSGANTMKQNGFGVINDIIAAVNSGNRDDLYDKMIPKIDNLINNILGVQAEGGALIARYNYNTDRLTQENSIMTEENDNLVTVDPVDAITQLYVADYMYQANLAVIARLVQPSLLDFLS